jgi:competence protein CoiA
MTQAAWTRTGEPVDAGSFSNADWEALKTTSVLGDFLMPCCRAPAVLKTSINGLAFFAHLSDECATAPETKWHLAGKAAVLAALKSMGIHGQEEVSGKSPTGSWEADVLFEVDDGPVRRRIAIELQRSYQHLRDYVRRQERYTTAGVESYWLTTRAHFVTFTKASGRLRLKRDFAGVMPASGGFFPMVPEVSLGMLELEKTPVVHFGGMKSAPLADWLVAIVEGCYTYHDGLWLIDGARAAR